MRALFQQTLFSNPRFLIPAIVARAIF